MKDLKITILITVILSLPMICSCSSEEDKPIITTDEQLLINGGKEWSLDNGGAVEINGVNITDDWADFLLFINDGTYTTSGSADLEVWPSSGEWQLKEGQIIRSDGIILDYTVTQDMLQITFQFDNEGRLSGIEGGYKFTFNKE